MEEKQYYPAQKVSLELLDLFSKICKESDIRYCLVHGVALSQYLCGGVMPEFPYFTVALSYTDLLNFETIFNEKYKNTQYYLIKHDNSVQFNEFYVRLAKRSKIVLGKGRESDEQYYDFSITLIPYFYVGNTLREYKKMHKEFQRYYTILNASPITPGTIKLGNLTINKIKSAYYYKHKISDNASYDEMLKKLSSIKEETRYVLLGQSIDFENIEILSSTYRNVNKCVFEGIDCFTVEKPNEYIHEKYVADKYESIDEYIDKLKINKAALDGPEVLRRVQLIELELLIEFDRICRLHNVKYILGAGTALGAIRHKGFIPWDDDIDVFMVYEEYQRFLEIADSELDHEKFFLKTQESDKDCNLTYAQLKRNGTKYSKGNREQFDTHPGVLIDILPLFNAPRTRIMHRIQDKICKYYKSMTWAHIGAYSVKDEKEKKKYLKMAQTDNKEAYAKFMRYATMIKKPSKGLTFFYVNRNFKENAVNSRAIYENVMEAEFEGHKFLMTSMYEYYLTYTYSSDYMSFPKVNERSQNKHMPAVIDTGDLYKEF